MCYIIYKTTNLITNKIYVGQHCSSADDGYLGSGIILKRSVDKYGKENFIREILDYCTSGDVNEKEIVWIAELSATDKSIGYNINPGGGGFCEIPNIDCLDYTEDYCDFWNGSVCEYPHHCGSQTENGGCRKSDKF